MIWKILGVVLIIVVLIAVGHYVFRKVEKEWHNMIFG
jgi:uncharacterized protein YneF (UPF0154 family)